MKRNEELGFSMMNTGSGNRDRIAGDSHHNDTTIPRPGVSASPFPNWNASETSQYYSLEPALGNSAIGSSQSNSSQQPDFGFSWPQGPTGWPYQYTSQDNLTISDDVMNTAFNLSRSVKPESSGKRVVPSDGSASRPQMVNPGGMLLTHTGHPLPNTNSGMALFDPNQIGAEPLLSPGKFDDRFMAVGPGTNKESESDLVLILNKDCPTEKVLLPPSQTSNNQQGSRKFSNSGLNMNVASSDFQNGSEIVSDLAHIGNQEIFYDAHGRPTLHLGPSNAFQRLASGDQNNYLRQVNRDLDLGVVKDINMESANSSHRSGFERCRTLPSPPFVGSQTMPSGSVRRRVNGHFVPSSVGMIGLVADESPSELLPKNNGTFSSKSFAVPPSVFAARSTRGQDPSSNRSQSQVVGSTQQQPIPPFGPYSASGPAKVSTPIPSRKRASSQPPSSTVQQDQRRRIQPTHPLIPPPNWTRSVRSVPNAPQSIPPLVHTAQSLPPIYTPPLTQSLSPTRTVSTLPAQNTTQQCPPMMSRPSFLPSSDKRISPFHPSSHTPPLTNQQQIAQSLARQQRAQTLDRQQRDQPQVRQQIAQPQVREHSRAPIMSSTADFSPQYIECIGQSQTMEPIGYKCSLCMRDLSFAPEGPISQPPIPPAAAVLSCGHTFHDYCLERITPFDQLNAPPCIPCALGE